MLTEETRRKFIVVGKAVAAARGWPWIEPVEVRLDRTTSDQRFWTIRTNALSKGRNIRLLIRESDLAVIEAAFLPR